MTKDAQDNVSEFIKTYKNELNKYMKNLTQPGMSNLN